MYEKLRSSGIQTLWATNLVERKYVLVYKLYIVEKKYGK